jgi:hypothetical protein
MPLGNVSELEKCLQKLDSIHSQMMAGQIPEACAKRCCIAKR